MAFEARAFKLDIKGYESAKNEIKQLKLVIEELNQQGMKYEKEKIADRL